MRMQEMKDKEILQGELPVLVDGQQWKLRFGAGLLAFGGASYLMPDGIAAMLGVSGAAADLGATALCLASFGWAASTVRCRHCGLRLVMYAMSHQSIGQWLHWLLAVKQCPKCGADHTGRRA